MVVLFRNFRFMLNEMTWQNTSKAILLEHNLNHVFFSFVFHFVPFFARSFHQVYYHSFSKSVDLEVSENFKIFLSSKQKLLKPILVRLGKFNICSIPK